MTLRFEFLDCVLVDRIVDEAMMVLERTGVLVEHDASRARLEEAGCPVDAQTGRTTVPRDAVDRALASAPDSFLLYGRDGTPRVRIGGQETHFAPGSAALRILDRRTGAVREPDTADFIEYVKVGHGLSNLSSLSTAFAPQDVPQEIADAWRLYLALAHSDRPLVSGAYTAHGVDLMGRIMEVFRHDRNDLVKRPLSIFTCCPNTPLRWGEDSIRNLVDCAEWGIPVEVVPVVIIGATAPTTPVGALVLHVAEVLSGIVFVQAIRPGNPVLFGAAPATFHMQEMTSSMAAVEALRLCAGSTQIARTLGVPSQAYMALSDARFNDPQAGSETGMSAILAAMAGVHSVSGPGMLDYVNCFSLEKLVFDDEIVAQVRHFMRPPEVLDDLPMGELIQQLLGEGHLLTSDHTLRHWETALYMPGPIVDRMGREQWEAAGARPHREAAAQSIDDALARYQEDAVEASVHEEIRRLLSSSCQGDAAPLPPS